MRSGRVRAWGLVSLTALGCLAFAAPAGAAQLYVDRDVIDISNNCLVATPCDQISEALNLADADDNSADTIHVGRSAGAYGSVTIPSTPVSLLGGEFNAGADGAATIVDGNASAGMTVTGSSFARTIDGFTIEGGDSAAFVCALQDSGSSTMLTIGHNLLDEQSAQLEGHICLQGSPLIQDNVVQGNDQAIGIEVTGTTAAQIRDNSVAGTERSIDVEGVGTTGTQIALDRNTIDVLATFLSPAAGIFLLGATGDVRDNLITMNPSSTLVSTDGIYASNNDTDGSLRLARNRITGFTKTASHGFDLVTPDPVTLDSDLFAGNTFGIVSNGNGTPNSITLTNETLWGNTVAEVRLANNPTEAISVDSSIIGDTGVVDSAGSTCTTSFSRGPVVADSCGPYATTATPSFAGASDFRLTPGGNGSLIDMGNPAAPSAATDLAGNPRAIAVTACPARRDIGAYELATNPLDCSPPASPPATQPQAKRKKCKKKHKHRSAAAAKKCKHKKRL
jgi:hypothetical protein